MTTHKKRDTMVHNNTNATDSTNPSILLQAQTNIIPFIPSARLSATGIIPAGDDNSRTSDNTFCRGYKETFTINTNSPDPWEFRYVAFHYKGDDLFVNATGTQFYSPDPSSSGTQMTRTAGVYPPTLLTTLVSVMFQGSKGTDWTSEQIAPIDTSRITVRCDKKFYVKSGNDVGTSVRKTMWIPVNKNLIYDDDEKVASYLSTGGKPGCGDLYVIIFANVAGGAATASRASILFNGVYYWHER